MFSCNKQLLILKLFLLAHYGALLSFSPFTTLQGLTAGMSMDQIALVNTVVPVSAVLGPIIAGFLADKLGNNKIVFATFQTCVAVTTWGFVFLEKTEYRYTLPGTNSTFQYNASTACNESQHNCTFEHTLEGQQGFSSFGKYFILMVSYYLVSGGTYSLADSIMIDVAIKNNANLGRQKLCICIGLAVYPLLSGFLVDLTKNLHIKGLEIYSTTTYLSTIMAAFALIAVSQLTVKVAPPEGKHISRDIFSILNNIDVIVFILGQTLAGSAYSFKYTYDFSFLETLQAPSYLQGLTLTTGSVLAIGVMFSSDRLLVLLGPARVLMIALLSFFIRMLGYSFLTDPWLALLCNVLDALTWPLAYASANFFCRQSVPQGLIATMAGVINASYFGLGTAVGGSLGGLLIARLGYRSAYRALGTASGVMALLYFLAYHWKLVHMERSRDRRESREHQLPCSAVHQLHGD